MSKGVEEKLASPNFGFLEIHGPLLVKYATRAERYVFDDPNSSLVKTRQLAETIAKTAAARAGLDCRAESDFLSVLQQLRDAGLLTPEINQLFHGIRIHGNKAVHDGAEDRSTALYQLKMARNVAIWFHRTFGNAANFKPGPFTPPPSPRDADLSLQLELAELRERLADYERATGSLEARVENAERKAAHAFEEMAVALNLAEETEERLNAELQAYEAQLAQVATDSTQPVLRDLVQASEQAAQDLDISEADTRREIDEQLRDAGWEADTQRLRFEHGVRPQKGKNVAIAEWPTGKGFADYVLFSGLSPLAIVEAKRRSKDVPSVLEQAKVYSRDYLQHADESMPGGPWGDYQIPFLFATNGRPYLKQIRTKSGIWFWDARRATNASRPLEGWYTPEGLSQLLAQDVQNAEARLETEPLDVLDLRGYQKDAIAAVERAIRSGRQSILLAMATGTGKTRTAIGLIYRLVKAKRFRRVLFLVDRTSLGEQAANAFKDVKLENLQSFTDIYDVKELGDIKPDTETKLHFATIQGMMRRLLYASDPSEAPPVDAYDCIVVDECHRGYNLDREMSEAELTFRDEKDYISKYSRVLEHFDAVKIGLTATPALHTTELLGPPVYEYSYRQAVIEGYLVDHEPPVRIVTKLAEDGITWAVGEAMQVYTPKTGQIDLFNAPDEVNIEVEQFNRKVMTENFNRVVCRELAQHIDPTLPGKTLVFCVTDQHADLVVLLLKEAFREQYGEIEDDAVAKITGAANTYRPGQLIRRYKNERLPSVAVTVDLLTTGIDVPEITNIVFIRRVKSRILYEQMLGRATRLCPEIEKETFRIFDAVDLYAALEDVTNMRPVTANPSITFAQLERDLTNVSDDAILLDLKDQLLAKLQRKKRTFQKSEEFAAVTGMDPSELIAQFRAWTPGEITTWFQEHHNAAEFLDNLTASEGPRYLISDHEDELVRVERGYGKGRRPEDFLQSFGKFVRDNLNAIPALIVVTQRPRDLTRQQLKELRLLLGGEGYTETNLRSAYKETTNQDIAASIIGYIRQAALGSPLVPYDDRVRNAMHRILASRPWTAPQRQWLERIGKQLLAETVVDREALDGGSFKQQGGFKRLNKVFDGKLASLLQDINEALWTEPA